MLPTNGDQMDSHSKNNTEAFYFDQCWFASLLKLLVQKESLRFTVTFIPVTWYDGYNILIEWLQFKNEEEECLKYKWLLPYLFVLHVS